jgi:hypothetical protein
MIKDLWNTWKKNQTSTGFKKARFAGLHFWVILLVVGDDTGIGIWQILPAEFIPSVPGSIDLSIDPGLKSQWITFPCSEWTTTSTKYSVINILMILMILMVRRRVSCLKASQWLKMNRSLDRSRFNVAIDYRTMFRMGACIYCNYCLIFCCFLNVCSLIAIHQIRHSSSERKTDFAPISDQMSMTCTDCAAASTRTFKITHKGHVETKKKIPFHPFHISDIILLFFQNQVTIKYAV